MTKTEINWDKLKENPEKYHDEYCKFVYNPENEFKCDNCPDNQGFDSWQGLYPCGQWHCWVTVHCFPEEVN